tara:strand:+ start:94068 stop:94379 length:312 start_codon:yes stop_codon:yes gene_type:complete
LRTKIENLHLHCTYSNDIEFQQFEKWLKIGRDERIRTSDPHTPSVMRYQAALRPDRGCAYMEVGGAWQVVCLPIATFPEYGFRCALAERVIGARIIQVGRLGA